MNYYTIIKKYYLSLIIGIGILVLSLMPVSYSSESSFFNIPHLDKLAHILLYAALSFTIMIEGYLKNKVIGKHIIIVVLLSFIYGSIIELIQLFLPGRSGEFLDSIADLTGSLFAVLLFKLYIRFK